MTIEARNVSKRFGSFCALDDVSLQVETGSLTALLGPSGSGKSTLLRVIAGLEQPDSGEIVISGADATALAPQERGVGFVFQHYAALPSPSIVPTFAILSFSPTSMRTKSPFFPARFSAVMSAILRLPVIRR
jgi:sulfate transport system ATP-binding protein